MAIKMGEVLSVRKTYGETLAQLGATREDIVVVELFFLLRLA